MGLIPVEVAVKLEAVKRPMPSLHPLTGATSGEQAAMSQLDQHICSQLDAAWKSAVARRRDLRDTIESIYEASLRSMTAGIAIPMAAQALVDAKFTIKQIDKLFDALGSSLENEASNLSEEDDDYDDEE